MSYVGLDLASANFVLVEKALQLLAPGAFQGFEKNRLGVRL